MEYINSLKRFIDAQENKYEIALNEIKNGKKRTHWMWYIFPQLRGLGESEQSYFYGIVNIAEAKAYLEHSILSNRLIEISEVLLLHKDKKASQIFGVVDELKLKSSMTLFALLSENNSVFNKVLEYYFNGRLCERTKKIFLNKEI